MPANNMEQENFFLPVDKHYIVEDNMDLIHHILHVYFDLPSSVYEDCFQEGAIALMTAYSKFDESRGTKFQTFAYTYILGYIHKYIKSQLPSLKYPVRMMEARAKVTSMLEDGMTANEICEILNLSGYQYAEIVKIGESVSFNAKASLSTDEHSCYEDIIEDKNNSISGFVNRDTIMGYMQKLLPHLDEEWSDLYLEYMENIISGDKVKQEVLAEKYGHDKGKVSKMIKKYNKILKTIIKDAENLY